MASLMVMLWKRLDAALLASLKTRSTKDDHGSPVTIASTYATASLTKKW